MSHDDIRREFQAARRDPPNEETATAEVRADRDRFLSRAKPGLWLGIRPTGRLDLTDRDDEVIRLLTDPDASDNRHPRWSFFNRYVGVARDEASWTLGTPDGTQIAVYIDGRVELTVALDMLATRGGDNELRGLALLDHPVAVMRMLKQLLGSATGAIAADVALHGVAGWGLRPYAEDRIGHLERLERRPQDKPDILLLDPLEFRSDRLLESPDSCGLELGRRLYRGFGLTDEHLPHFADLATGTLSS